MTAISRIFVQSFLVLLILLSGSCTTPADRHPPASSIAFITTAPEAQEDREGELPLSTAYPEPGMPSPETTLSLEIPPAETAKPVEAQETPLLDRGEGLNIPLAVGLLDPASFDFLEARLRQDDIVAVRARNVPLLDSAPEKRKMVILISQDESGLAAYLDQAHKHGVEIIGYNLEGKLTGEELAFRQGLVYEKVKQAGFPMMFGPMVVHLERYYADLVKHTDMIVVQSQRYQSSSDFADRVLGLVREIKSARSDLKIWIQVSVNPPGQPDIPPEQVLDQINSISAEVDGIFLFYSFSHWAQAQEVIESLRP